jgi:hypothetical protein
MERSAFLVYYSTNLRAVIEIPWCEAFATPIPPLPATRGENDIAGLVAQQE